MSTQFQPNTLAYGDQAGLGLWLVGHYRQHLAYDDFLAKQSPPVIIAPYSILVVLGGSLGTKQWLNDHQSWHAEIRPYANVTGIDLSEVNLDEPEQFYQWMDLHNQEHAAIDSAFGVG